MAKTKNKTRDPVKKRAPGKTPPEEPSRKTPRPQRRQRSDKAIMFQWFGLIALVLIVISLYLTDPSKPTGNRFKGVLIDDGQKTSEQISRNVFLVKLHNGETVQISIAGPGVPKKGAPVIVQEHQSTIFRRKSYLFHAYGDAEK